MATPTTEKPVTKTRVWAASPQLIPFIRATIVPGITLFMILSGLTFSVGSKFKVAPYVLWATSIGLITMTINQSSEWISVFMTPDDFMWDTIVLTAYLTVVQQSRLYFLYRAVATYLDGYGLTVSQVIVSSAKKAHLSSN